MRIEKGIFDCVRDACLVQRLQTIHLKTLVFDLEGGCGSEAVSHKL